MHKVSRSRGALAEKLPKQWGFHSTPQFGIHAHQWWKYDRPVAIDPNQMPYIDCSLEMPAPAVQVWDLKIVNRTVPVATTCPEVEELFALLRK